MSENTSCSGINAEQRYHLCRPVCKNQSDHHNRKHTFQAVANQRHCPCLLSESTQGICRSCVAASMLTNIGFVHFSDDIGCLEKPKHIANQNTNQTFRHFTQLFSPRSRIINFREVPLKPKASLTLFSMYLV